MNGYGPFAGFTGRCFPRPKLSTARWRTENPLVGIEFKDLWFTQAKVRICALLDRPCVCDEPESAPFAVRYDGRLFLYDGHHRAIRHALVHNGRWMNMYLHTLETP